MLKFTRKKQTKLELEIESVLDTMRDCSISSDEYRTAMEYLNRLYDLKSKDEIGRVSPDTVAIVAGNLLGIVLILKYEELNIITSKALGFVIKGRA